MRARNALDMRMESVPPPLPPPYVEKPMGQDAGVRLLLPVGRSPWAIAAGYFGLLSVIPVFSIPALICGIVALMDIKKSRLGPKPKHGMGRAWFGIIMGVLGLAFGIFLAINILSEA